MSEVFFQMVLDCIHANGTTIKLKKGDFLIREGQIEEHLYFIESGAVLLYYQSDFDQRILRFGYDGSIINSLASFLTGEPSEFFIEALKASEIIRLHKREFEKLKTEINLAYSSFLEALLARQIDREIDLLINSPGQRLERLLKRSPHLFQHIPLKYIASYLRMEPETLSRIRKS